MRVIQLDGYNPLGYSGTGSWYARFTDPIMVPTHAHQIGLAGRVIMSPTGGIESITDMIVDQESMIVLHRVWTPDDISEFYEKVHHRVHGFDPRGLDPREGRTRLRA